jgi:hypothetical protein
LFLAELTTERVTPSANEGSRIDGILKRPVTELRRALNAPQSVTGRASAERGEKAGKSHDKEDSPQIDVALYSSVPRIAKAASPASGL